MSTPSSRTRLEFIGNDSFRLVEDKSSFQPESGEALIRVHLCGICGSDLSYIKAVAHTPDSPIVLGHEMVGEIISMAGASDKLAPGDLVVANPGIECGRCDLCARGLVNVCPNTRFAGYGSNDGFMRDYLTYPLSHLYRVRCDALSAVLAEPMAVSVHALRIAKLSIGMTALVAGCGGIGALLVFLLKRNGVSFVVATDPVESRRELATAMGADLVLDPTGKRVDDLQREVRQAGIDTVDRYFEASGGAQAMLHSTGLTSPGGTIVAVGIPDDDQLVLSHSQARKKELSIVMSRTICHDFPTAIRLLETYPDLRGVVGGVRTKDAVAAGGLSEFRLYQIPGRAVVDFTTDHVEQP